jgi:hypothetical protein
MPPAVAVFGRAHRWIFRQASCGHGFGNLCYSWFGCCDLQPVSFALCGYKKKNPRSQWARINQDFLYAARNSP